MCRASKSLMWLALLLIIAVAACAPAATSVPPAPQVVEVTTVVEVVKSVTATPLPTATPGPINGQFNAGGVNLNLICRGEGSPTVVLDAGWGMDHLTWYAIMPKIQSHTRVCVYDRASMGNSDKQAGHRTSQKIAEQLHTLLANAKVEGPYIVVGHSLGGMNMLVFADRFRGEVAGAVLVDSAHPDQRERLLAILPTPAPDEPAGLRRLREDLPLANPRDPRFPEPMDWDSTLAQVRAVKSLSSIPLSVLVAADPKKTKFKGIPNEMAASLDKVWLDLQKEHAALSSDSQLILAEHSGHFIQNDEPQLVIDAILGLVDKARQK